MTHQGYEPVAANVKGTEDEVRLPGGVAKENARSRKPYYSENRPIPPDGWQEGIGKQHPEQVVLRLVTFRLSPDKADSRALDGVERSTDTSGPLSTTGWLPSPEHGWSDAPGVTEWLYTGVDLSVDNFGRSAGHDDTKGGFLVQVKHSPDEWETFKDCLRGSVSTANWQTWLSRLNHEREGDTIILIAPSDFHLEWVRDKHHSAISEAVDSTFGPEMAIDYRVGEVAPHPVSPPIGSPQPQAAPPPTPEPAPSLVGRYRFDSFVVGPSNRFANAASMSVAEKPGVAYNPLFIYGPAGLGKTHLLNAVGHHSLELYPDLSVRYVTSENFLNDFIECIRRKRVDDFKHRYRSVDVLLLDDVQFFERKEQILEEFFHTFNNLYESGKQMVISSDRHPRNLSTLGDRLRSRFEWGLITDIQPPDVETRLAILRRNAELAPKPVPIDVLEFIASLVSDNIRELEGALTRVSAFAALTDGEINLDMAQSVLQDLIPGHGAKALTAAEIIRTTASAYGFGIDEVTGKSRRQPLVLCRQVAMYLCRDLTDLSLPKIGAQFGGRDHTTVIHSVDKVQTLLRTDRDVFDRVNRLSQQLRGA